MDEETLISEFLESRSDEAFAASVKRHVDFVYATARGGRAGKFGPSQDQAQVLQSNPMKPDESVAAMGRLGPMPVISDVPSTTG